MVNMRPNDMRFCDFCPRLYEVRHMRTREGLRICPICLEGLGLTDDDTIPMLVGGIDHSRYPFRMEDY